MSPGFPLPDLADPQLAPFWNWAAEGELRLPQSADGRFQWYPTDDAVNWVRLSGRATLYSWTIVSVPLDPRYAAIVPYTAAIVVPAEAPDVRLVTRLVDVTGRLEPGMSLELCIRDVGYPGPDLGFPAPLFRPAACQIIQS